MGGVSTPAWAGDDFLTNESPASNEDSSPFFVHRSELLRDIPRDVTETETTTGKQGQEEQERKENNNDDDDYEEAMPMDLSLYGN